MTLAYWCVLAAALLPYLTVAPAKVKPDFDNRRPRDWEDRQDGWRKRLYWAHLNGFEAFAPFAAAVVIAHLAQAPQNRIDALAAVFVIARIAYGFCYYADLATLRSLVWTVGFACVVALFFIGA
jgi:uncharacterized MAPEG superfamily protein